MKEDKKQFVIESWNHPSLGKYTLLWGPYDFSGRDVNSSKEFKDIFNNIIKNFHPDVKWMKYRIISET